VEHSRLHSPADALTQLSSTVASDGARKVME